MTDRDLLLVMMDIEPELEPEFNRWYDAEHFPEMLSVPGIERAQRYRVLRGRPRHLAIYDLESVEVLEKPEYLRIAAWSPEASPRSREMFGRFINVTRGVYRYLQGYSSQPDDPASRAQSMVLRGVEVLPEHEEEFLQWDSSEHLHLLSQVPGVLEARRYRLHRGANWLIGDPAPHLTCYFLASPEVQNRAEWRSALDTPWSRRVRRFYQSPIRNLYTRVA